MSLRPEVVLRQYQVGATGFIAARHDQRALIVAPTSAGKTLMALATAESLGAKRVLVVAPAMARPTWQREVTKWTDRTAFTIQHGRTRKNLTKAQAAYREAAYSADFQVVSYDLLDQVDPKGWDFIIADETHNLRSPTSAQSLQMRERMRIHRGPAIGLTATLMPTQARNVWNQLETFFPGWYGARTGAGKESWKFLSAFCNRTQNDYSEHIYTGAKTEAMPLLAAALAPYVYRVTEADFAHYLPPLNADILWLDAKTKPEKVATEWLDEKLYSVSHTALVCYNHTTADLLKNVGEKCKVPTFCITGLMSPEKRQLILDAYAAEPRAILVATSESIRESVDLSFVDAVLIFEWRTSPASALQLVGRFARSNRIKTGCVCIQYVAQPGDDARAEKLKERIDAANAALKADAKSELVADVFKPRAMTDERLDSMFETMFKEVHLSLQEDGEDDE